jgi:hypothetical protein
MYSATMIVSAGSTTGILSPEKVAIVVKRYKKFGQTGTLGDPRAATKCRTTELHGRFRVRSECDGLPKVLVMASWLKEPDQTGASVAGEPSCSPGQKTQWAARCCILVSCRVPAHRTHDTKHTFPATRTYSQPVVLNQDATTTNFIFIF